MKKEFKNIIIISFLFPPYNQIGARRAYFFSKYLTLLGHKVTVITSELPNEFSKWNVDTSFLDIIRLPIINMNLIKQFQKNSRVITFFNTIFSPLEAAKRISTANLNFDKISTPDFIIATGGPWHIFELGTSIKNKFKNSKLIFDYRDAWTLYNKEVGIDSLNNFGKGIGKIKEVLMKKKEKKLLSSADAVISITRPVLENVILNPRNKKGIKNEVIYNGFESFILNKIIKKEKFLIVYPGTIRKEQEHEIFLKGYKLFLDDPNVNSSLVDCYFIGSDHPKLQKLLLPFKRFSYQNNLKVTELIDNEMALNYQKKSSVLLNFGYTGKKGIMSGKIFEYLAIQENILVISKEHDVMEELVRKTGSGKTANSADSVYNILLDWYNEFIAKGYVEYKVNLDEVNFYKFENQVKILNKFLKKI